MALRLLSEEQIVNCQTILTALGLRIGNTALNINKPLAMEQKVVWVIGFTWPLGRKYVAVPMMIMSQFHSCSLVNIKI